MLLKDVKPESGQKIWAQCLNQDGAKTFSRRRATTCGTICRTGRVISARSCRTRRVICFFDLDEGDVHATWKRIQPLIDAFLDMLELTYHHVLLDASTETKGSLHVITRASKFVLASPVQGKQFVQQLESIHNVSLGLDTVFTPETDASACSGTPSTDLPESSAGLGPKSFGCKRSCSRRWYWRQSLGDPSMFPVH